MNTSRPYALLVLAAMLVHTSGASGQPVFRTELKDKYDFRTVSCYTCHMRKSEVPPEQLGKFKENARAFRNAFGRQLEELLQGKNITQRLNEVKGLPRDDAKRETVEEQVKREFHDALRKLETKDYPDGGTYKEALEKGLLDGIKLK